MKLLPPRRGPILGLLACLLLAAAPLAGARAADCNDVVDRRYLNVLSLNLLFSEVTQRKTRFERIAEFLREQRESDDPVDILLLQEVVGGALVGTDNSAEDLEDEVEAATGEDYELRTAFEAGLPGVLATANAILSRCDIRFHFARFLPLTSEVVELGDLSIPISRNIMMVRIDVPGFRRLNIYNTHLCAGACTVPELADQADSALDFVNDVERFFSFFRRRPHVLGGDFNQDNFRGEPKDDEGFGPEFFIYESIVYGENFEDAYAEAQGLPLTELCENEAVADEHCTVGVSEFDGDTSRRIDYVFQRGFGGVGAGKVVFNPGGRGDACEDSADPACASVSDHAGVLVKLGLPGFALGLSSAQ